jgi:hypothetical protein
VKVVNIQQAVSIPIKSVEELPVLEARFPEDDEYKNSIVSV